METNHEIEKAIYFTTYLEMVNKMQDLIDSGFKPSHDLFAYAGKLGKMAELPPEVLKGLELLKDGIRIY